MTVGQSGTYLVVFDDKDALRFNRLELSAWDQPTLWGTDSLLTNFSPADTVEGAKAVALIRRDLLGPEDAA